MVVAPEPEPAPAPPSSPRTWPLSLAIAVAIHATVAALLVGADRGRSTGREPPVEMEVTAARAPAPTPEAPRPPPPVRPPPAPRRVMTLAPIPDQPAPPAPSTPPPNQEPPPNAAPAPPLFGVTANSTVADDSPTAVPVGNTVPTNDRTRAPPGPPPPPIAAGGAPTFTPVPDASIATAARVILQIDSADIYPPEAARMGVEGHVELRVGVDENGDVKEVEVIKVKPPGYKFDLAAAQAMRRFKFAPARTSDGKAVASRLTYRYSFMPAQ